MKNKFKVITLFMSMMVIIAFASFVEVENIVYSSEISETGLYTVYQIQQEKTGGKSIEDYEIFEVEENRTIEKEVSGLYGTTYTRPKAPTSADYNFSKWLDSDGSVAPTTFGAENKTFVASWKLKGEGGDEIPEGFVLVAGTSISGTETWTPTSNVFVSDRSITIPDLIVSDHEVTRGEYKDVMGSDPSTASANDKDGNELEGDDV